jgi:hypothetical protein
MSRLVLLPTEAGNAFRRYQTAAMLENDRDRETTVRDDSASTFRDYWPGGALAPQSRQAIATARRRRWTLVSSSALLGVSLIAGALWTRGSTAATSSVAQWDLQLASGGAQPVTALVFGHEAGIHLVQLPAAGGAAELRRSIPVRLGQGDVYMVSLGRNRLEISAASPPGSVPMRFAAEGRFVKLVHTSEATGVRTGWW